MMRVAVITPYYNTPDDWLAQCCESVNRQTHPCTHFLIADGVPQSLPADFSGQHIPLPTNIGNYGDTPRAIGSIAAISQGFEAVAYLDSDNWYEPGHIQSLVELQARTGADVCTSARNIFNLDGETLGKCPSSDGTNFVDTNCLLLNKTAFPLVNVWWMMPPQFHCIGDRVLWYQIVKRRYKTAHLDTCSVAYRSAFKWHYTLFNQVPPEDSKSGLEIKLARKAFEEYIESDRQRRT